MQNEWQLWRKQLAPADQETLDDLLEQLQAVGGDLGALPASALATLNTLAQRYADLTSPVSDDRQVPEEETAVTDVAPVHQASTALLRDEWVLQVCIVLRQELCDRGGTLADAVMFAFQHKWLPEALRDADTCGRWYKQWSRQIDSATAFSRDEHTGQPPLDLPAKVGLAWFTTVYRLHQMVVQGVDFDA